jgi:hypothetical protein
VKDRLPEKYRNGKRYKVWAANLDEESSMIIVYADLINTDSVIRTHWMPLPEPPKTEI